MVSHIKYNKMLLKVYLYNLVRFNDIEHEFFSIDSISIVTDFQDVFPKELLGILLELKIDFFV